MISWLWQTSSPVPSTMVHFMTISYVSKHGVPQCWQFESETSVDQNVIPLVLTTLPALRKHHRSFATTTPAPMVEWCKPELCCWYGHWPLRERSWRPHKSWF
jgi:hypothetical protein